MKKTILTTGIILSFIATPTVANNNFNLSFENDQNSAISQFIEPGKKINDSITLKNNSGTENLNFKIYAADSKNSSNGNFGFKLDGTSQNHIGQWMEFPEKEYDLKPNQQINIPFHISVPSYANPGTYAGGIVTEHLGENQNSANKTMARKVKPIFLEIAGERNIDYSLDNFSFNLNDNKPEFYFSVTNSGTIFININGSIEITGGFLSGPSVLEIEESVILQEKTQSKAIKWNNPPLFGNFKAKLNLNVYELNTKTNQLEPIDTIQKNIEFSILPTSVIIVFASLIVLIIGPFVFLFLFRKKQIITSHNRTVKKDETLKQIADDENIAWKKIAHLNKLKAPYSIKTGQKLKIPKK
ncbi:LysM peptidoglycan-binding domain-containing protein [Candidatus Peregrinibacteria bacterium]|nr:LysM peptidoglycan-binding domain-containing protein [Candidatus Peregrinibacteria bacterium]